MSNEALTALQQRWLAISLLLLVSLLVSLILIVPIINKGLALHDSKNNLLFKLQQYEKILARKEAVVTGIEKIKQQNATQGYFNGQETEALASAAMQESIKIIIDHAGGKLISTQAIPPENTPQFNRIPVKVNMTGNSAVLRTVLYQIETAVPIMIIDQLDIIPVRGPPNLNTGQPEPSNELEINFQAVSFMRKAVP